jgi:hypothetical protein
MPGVLRVEYLHRTPAKEVSMTPNIHAIILHVSLEVRCIDRLYLQVVA